jgi:hypothetical protein
MRFFARRRAQLRREYADRYPRVAPGIWLGARRVAGTVRRTNHEARLREQLGQRILPDAHFEFQGGQSRQPADTRTRRTDRASEQSATLGQRLTRAINRFVTTHLVAEDPYERAKNADVERQRHKATRRRPRSKD